MQRVHELEEIVDQIFDQVCPVHQGQVRALKPFLAPALGCLVPDANRRHLQDRRTYHRLDFTDFLDYSTSGLASASLLSHFPDNEARFYQALDTAPGEPLITFSPFDEGVAVLDVSLARSEVFVSATMRFKVFGESKRSTLIATMTFAPMAKYKGDPLFDPETSTLEEWDRYLIFPPIDEDREWRFAMSGIYTDYLLDDMEKRPRLPGALSAERIAEARKLRETNQTAYAGIFELTRLALLLPSYFDFMYDLVVEEAVPVRRHVTPQARGTATSDVPLDVPIYRIVKSIRVVRETPGPVGQIRSWKPPQYSFAVKGHWRHYEEPSTKGHDPAGNVVLGKTWVRDYTKGKGKPPRPGETETFCADARVIINIKQTLAHARDIMAARAPASEAVTHPPTCTLEQPPTASGPTIEWMATERAKLTSSLRFVIMKRDGFRCRLCGKSASHENAVRLEVDHIKPVSSWGTTVEKNLWTLCRECNRGKNDRPLAHNK